MTKFENNLTIIFSWMDFNFLDHKFLEIQFCKLSLLELNSNNANKEGSKESDPSGRICGEIGNGICCGEQIEEQ
jgi:hypothetical protein